MTSERETRTHPSLLSSVPSRARGDALSRALWRVRNSPLPFLLPALVGVVLFLYYPAVLAARNSLFAYNLLNPDAARFIGLENYSDLLQDERFLKSILNTLVYSGACVLLQVPGGLLLALLLDRRSRLAAGVRTAVFAPVVTAGSAVGLLWLLMYNPQLGLFNSLLGAVGLPPQEWTTSASQSMLSVVLMATWQGIGLNALIFIGGLQSIPRDLKEAALLDGAGAVALGRYIVVPLLRRTVVFVTILTTIISFTTFTPIFILTKGGPQDSTLTTIYYIWSRGYEFLQLGYASAMAVLFVAVLAGVSFLQWRALGGHHD